METEVPERKAALLLTDMVDFANKTARMTPIEGRGFLIGYLRSLESVIVKREDGTQHFEHAAGDATASVFERKGSEGDEEKSIHALRAALRLVHEIAENKIPSTRIGLYSGKVIEARTNNHSFQFGNSISAANRL